jgi:hypothetical protein
VFPENAKTGLIDISLECSIGKFYHFTSFGGAGEVFRAKIRSRHAVWMHSAEVDALFGLNFNY